MLFELREHLELPVEALAVLLGVPRITMRKWLKAERNPCGAAKRLIWVLHSWVFNPSIFRCQDAWLWWSRSRKEALERLEDRSGLAKSACVTAAPLKETSHDRSNIWIRRLREAVKIAPHLVGCDIQIVGITMLVQTAMLVSQAFEECDRCLESDGLEPETLVNIMRLKRGLIADQLRLVREILDFKRDSSAPPDDMPLAQPAFGRGEPATNSQENSDVNTQKVVSPGERSVS